MQIFASFLTPTLFKGQLYLLLPYFILDSYQYRVVMFSTADCNELEG